jgi:hypothetical protein
MKLLSACLLSLAIASVGTDARAQADGAQSPPPPRRAPTERRGQRLDRLRKGIGQAGQIFQALANDPALNPPPVDIAKLNDGLMALIKPLLGEEGGLESVQLRFDPAATNLARDTARLIGSATMRRSGWSDQPTLVDFDVRASVARQEDSRPRVMLDGGVRFQTDVIALANRVVVRQRRDLDRRAKQGAVREAPIDADETFRLHWREKLERTAELRTMDDVADLFIFYSGLRLAAANDRIDELTARIAAAADERAREDLRDDLAEARASRDQMFAIRPKVDRDDTGRARALTFTMIQTDWDRDTQIERFRLAITPRQLTLDVVGGTSTGVEAYALVKPILLNTLTRIQARDPATLELGRGMVRGYWSNLRRNLSGEEVPPGEAAPLPPPGDTPRGPVDF